MTVPHVADFNPSVTRVSALVKFSDIFSPRLFSEFCEIRDVTVMGGEPVSTCDYGEMFAIGGPKIREAARDNADALSFLRLLRPSDEIETSLSAASQYLYDALGVNHVCQLRIERDWQHYSRSNLATLPHESNTADYEIILSKVKRGIPDARRLYVTCDERSLIDPIETIRQFARRELDMEVFFKSDLPGLAEFDGRFALMTQLDFELALRARVFVGTTRSTFANMIALTRYAISGVVEGSDYIYNGDTNSVQARRDRGYHLSPPSATTGI